MKSYLSQFRLDNDVWQWHNPQSALCHPSYARISFVWIVWIAPVVRQCQHCSSSKTMFLHKIAGKKLFVRSPCNFGQMKTFDSSFESSFCDSQLPPILTQLKLPSNKNSRKLFTIKKWRESTTSSHQTFPTKLLTSFQTSEGFISKSSRDQSKMPCIVNLCQNWIKERKLIPKTSKSKNTYRLTTLPQVLIGSLL
jgi:hypothetical protein